MSDAPSKAASMLVLLGDEMRSFMAAAGWRQVGTDEQVRAAANQPW